MTPASYGECVFNVPLAGRYRLIMNSDAVRFGGTGFGGLDQGDPVFWTEEDDGDSPARLRLPLPPLAGIYLEYEGKEED